MPLIVLFIHGTKGDWSADLPRLSGVEEVIQMLSFSKKDKRLMAQIFMAGSTISVLLAAIGYMGTDIWLASTQWLLVAAVLALFGVYKRMES